MTQTCGTGHIRCYKATVNESETITAAQLFHRPRQSLVARPAPHLERS
jgi:hypothetical protein